MIKVLVADDSAFMRHAIEKMLSRDPEIDVIGFCTNGEEVLKTLETLKPDVLTLDIEMPKMNGLKVLEKIMQENPIPVIMVSSLTVEGAEETVKALELGAVDVVAKPGSFISLKITDIFEELSRKIKAASRARVFLKRVELPRRKLRFLENRLNIEPVSTSMEEIRTETEKFLPEVILIGISTGGPATLQKIIPRLPKDFPCGVIIAQHMPVGFTKILSTRLNSVSEIEVKEAEEGDIIKPGLVLVAPSGFQTLIKRRFTGYCTHILEETGTELYKPSIDLLFSSGASSMRNKVLGFVMTGMGNDGTEGSGEIKKAGGKVFAEAEESCVISSMPNSVIKAGHADRIYKLEEIPDALIRLFKNEK